MKIYTQDNGWRGSIVVIADNEKEARELMEKELNYEPTSPVEEHEITKGWIYVDYGDC